MGSKCYVVKVLYVLTLLSLINILNSSGEAVLPGRFVVPRVPVSDLDMDMVSSKLHLDT